MRVFIHAATLKVGGGKSVATNFLKETAIILAQHQTDFITAVVPNHEDYQAIHSPFIKLITVPHWLQNPIMRFFIMDIWIMTQLKKSQPDVIYSMGNIALPEKKIPQVLLFHNPHMIYPESPVWKIMHWKDVVYNRVSLFLFKKRLKYATTVLVQTETAGNRLKKYFGIKSFVVTPNAIALQYATSDQIPTNFSPNSTNIYLFCLSHYYPHKNLEIFIPLAKKIKAANLPYRIIVTLAPNQHPEAKHFLKNIETEGLTDIILNAGVVKMCDVPKWYKATQALLLPTLLESFSGTYIEAMHFERPIFTSNLDFAKEVCGDAAYYFDPMNADNILQVIENAFANPNDMALKITTGKHMIQNDFTWKHVAQQMYDQLTLTCTKP
jgi:glycosyltransferase involved in cell wall biosynthesis